MNLTTIRTRGESEVISRRDSMQRIAAATLGGLGLASLRSSPLCAAEQTRTAEADKGLTE